MSYFILRFSDLNGSTFIMDAIQSVTDNKDDYLSTATDGYHDTSAHAYQMDMDQDMSTDDDWLSNNTTDVYQSYWNAITDADTIDDQMTTDGYSALFSALLISSWTSCPFILTGNSLTIVVIARYIKKVTPTDVSIAFLAVAGLSVGVVDFLTPVMQLIGHSAHSEYVYGLISWVNMVAMGLNISAIFLIAFERCCLVTSSELHQKYLTVKRQVGLCVGFSVYFLVSATILTLMLDYEFRYGVLVPKFEQKTVVYVINTTPYTLISCSIAYCSLKIDLFVWKHRKALIAGQNSSNGKNFQKEKETTRLIAIILTVYLFGTLPTSAYGLMTGNNPEFMKPELWALFRLLWCATSLADILIYVLKVPEFTEGYRKILRCFRKHPTNQIVPQYSI